MSNDKSIYKSARLVILLRWQDVGLLDGKSDAEIARMFPESLRPSRWAIRRDMQDLPGLREILKEIENDSGVKAWVYLAQQQLREAPKGCENAR